MRLVADVGGTNTRLALSQNACVVTETTQSFTNEDWDSFYAIVSQYLSQQNATPKEIVAAVAGPVHGPSALLTNRNWTLETDVLQSSFNFERASLMNDLTALGYAVPALRTNQLTQLSDGKRAQDDVAQSLVVGIGTGFNLSPVVQGPNGVMCPAVEAGHVSMPRRASRALDQAGVDAHAFETVEDLFSGRGFTKFVQLFTSKRDVDGRAAIAGFGTPGSEKIDAAVSAYSSVLGHLLADLALGYMPTSGLYLAGSVARAVSQTCVAPCLEAFHMPGKIDKTRAVPIWTIDDDGAALLGCAGFS